MAMIDKAMSDVKQELGDFPNLSDSGDGGAIQHLTSEDNVGEISAGASMPNFADQASQFLVQHLQDLANSGVSSLYAQRQAYENMSVSQKMGSNAQPSEESMLPLGPGFNYITHLFKRSGMLQNSLKQSKKDLTNGLNIFTDQIEALKTAVQAMGIFSEKNPNGVPMDIKEAKKVFFGNKEVPNIDYAHFRTSIENGDSRIDPKKVRKFVNYDGSLTWEILNHDKTVMSRFTMGEYAGTKIFAQGGHAKFSDLLKQAREQIGEDPQADFDAVRSME